MTIEFRSRAEEYEEKEEEGQETVEGSRGFFVDVFLTHPPPFPSWSIEMKYYERNGHFGRTRTR